MFPMANLSFDSMIIFFDEEIGTFQDKPVKESSAPLSESSLKKIWDNPEDEIYNDL